MSIENYSDLDNKVKSRIKIFFEKFYVLQMKFEN